MIAPLARALVAIVVAGAAAAGIAALRPPSAPEGAERWAANCTGASAPGASFDVARALEHLRAIADAPRPVGSAKHRQVADTIVGAVAALGFTAEVQEAWGVNGARNVPAAALVRNIVVHVPGSRGQHATLVSAHYDSVPTGPGAGDDGAGVAAMLEVLRVLSREPPPRNDIVFLFSDAEEVGLLGAQAFRDHHPLDAKVRAVLNFEARGTRGPSIMFETGANNRWIVDQFRRAARHPIATSMAELVYRALPQSTDFAVLAEGRTGLAFAFIEDYLEYHTARDDLDELDPDSLFHHGSTMLALVRQLGGADLDPAHRPEGDVVYFDVLGASLVSYPARAALPFAAIAAFSFAFVLARAVRSGAVRLGSVWLAAAISLVGVAGGALLAQAIWTALERAVPDLSLPQGDPYRRSVFLAGLVGVALASLTGAAAWFRRSGRASELLGGVLIIWAALALVSAVSFTGASYLFLWPLVFGAALLQVMTAPESDRRPTLVAASTGALLVIPALLVAPAVVLLSVALTMRLAVIPAALAAIAAGLLLPLLGSGGHRLPVGVGLAAALLLGWGSARACFDRAHPRPVSMTYLEDADLRRAWWWTVDRDPHPWQRGRLGAQSESGPVPGHAAAPAALFSEVPPLALEPPRVEILDDRVADDGSRQLRLRVSSRRRAPVLEIHPEPAAAVREIDVAGKRFPSPPPVESFYPALLVWNAPADGVELRLSVLPGSPFSLGLTDVSFEPPPGTRVLARPPDTVAVPFGFGWSDEWQVATRLGLAASRAP